MNGMDAVWTQVEEFRRQYFPGTPATVPVDVFTVAELDLHLNIIPFDDMSTKYGMDAALTQDFTGIYVDAEAYQFLENGPVWKQKRLRFTFAHELGHFVMHREVAARHTFADFAAFLRWMREESPTRYTIEQEANEFAGRLLVPTERLLDDYTQFTVRAGALTPHWQKMPDLRRYLSESLSNKYGVNAQVIETRLDRESIWSAQ